MISPVGGGPVPTAELRRVSGGGGTVSDLLRHSRKKAVARKESVIDENSFCVRREKKTLLCEIPIPITIPKV